MKWAIVFLSGHPIAMQDVCVSNVVLMKSVKKHKMENKNMKWCLLVNSHEHTDAMKPAPSRKNVLTVKDTRGEARDHLED